jgi:hypothetical protein
MELKKSNGKVGEKILQAIEEFWEISKLPEDYRNFLLEHNGGIPLKKIFFLKDGSDAIGVDEFFGIIKGLNTNFSNLLFKQKYSGDRVPSNMLPIGRESLGNLILLSVKGPDRGKIYFWDHEKESPEGVIPDYSNLTLIADSFEEFFDNLHGEDEGTS